MFARKRGVVCAGVLAFACCLRAAPKPVIISTDIGDDIDDTWAVSLALKCPELDIKLIVGDYGNATERARLIAKILENAKRTVIPVGVGVSKGAKDGTTTNPSGSKVTRSKTIPARFIPTAFRR